MRSFIVLILIFLGCYAGCSYGQDGKEPVRLTAGMRSPDFKYSDVNGKTVSLKDFRGKYVYIDFWATWCPPCRQQTLYMKKLEEKFRGKKIVFVSISSDSNVENWKKFVEKNGLTGVQLNTGGDWDFIEAYEAQMIPRFVLLDKKGRIINPEMPWPSSDDIERCLSGLKDL